MTIKDAAEWANVAIAVAAVLAAGGTVWYASVAQKTLRSMQQVYVGVVGQTVRIDVHESLYFAFQFGAMGANVPARQVVAGYKLFVANTERHPERRPHAPPHAPHLLFPGVPVTMKCQMSPENAVGILKGDQILEVVIDISYLDFYDKGHEYQARYRFEPLPKSFAQLSETLN